MIDEDVLINALNDVANAFEVFTEGSDRILAEAEASEPPSRSHHVPTLISQPSRGRTYLVAAALIVIVAGVSIPLFRSEGNLNRINAFGPLGSRHSSQGSATTKAPPLVINGTGSSAALLSPGLGEKTLAGTGFADTGTKTGASSTSLKIESNGSISLTVNKGHVESAFTNLSKLATSDGGFVDSTQAHVGSRTSGKFTYGTIVVQVPQRNFAKLVAQAQRVGHSTSVITTSNDVTAQYVDLQAHITALEASRRQYLVIMTKATTINGILAVQSQLNTLQSQIEQLQGQLSVLSHATTYGTLTVVVSEAGHHAHATSPRTGFSKAWHDSVSGFVSGFQWLLRLAGPILFAVLALGALLTFAKFARRVLRRRRI
jgi:hypothetical protein